MHTVAGNRRRPMAAYKYNLLEHMGQVSSFTVRVDRPDFPKCYAPMADAWSLSKAERFQVGKAAVPVHFRPHPFPQGSNLGYARLL